MRTLQFLTVFLSLLFQIPAQGQSNEWQKDFMISINAGVSSFYGDLSVYDRQPLKKLAHESDAVVGISIGRQLSSVLSINASYIDGRLRGKNEEWKYYFGSDFNEFTIGSHIYISQLLFPYKSSRMKVYTTTGIGLLKFNSIERHIIESNSSHEQENNIDNEVNSSTPVLKLGLGCNYELSTNFDLSTEIAFRVTGNDMIDAHIGSTGINDYYSIFSVGIIYVFNRSRDYSGYSMPCGASLKSYRKKISRVPQACIPFN
jgi:hypothetical protein